MAISPPSDIVLDVLRAADPAEARTATDRLRKLAGKGPADATGFAALVDRPLPDPGPRVPFHVDRARVALNSDLNTGSDRSVLQRFEAFVLKSFVEAMLPKDSSAIYGEGSAGRIWRSMLAEGLADELAASGGIGIADSLSRELPEKVEGT